MSEKPESVRDGKRWVVAIQYEEPFEITSRFPAEALGLTVNGESVEIGSPVCFLVVDEQDWGEVRGRFKDAKRAQAKADELNRFDVQGPLDPEFAHRRQRLKRLAPHLGSWMHEGPPEARWPVRPGRYLIHGFDDGWHGEAWDEFVDTKEAVRDVLTGYRGHEVMRVIDLDTGEELPFERHVSVEMADG